VFLSVVDVIEHSPDDIDHVVNVGTIEVVSMASVVIAIAAFVHNQNTLSSSAGCVQTRRCTTRFGRSIRSRSKTSSMSPPVLSVGVQVRPRMCGRSWPPRCNRAHRLVSYLVSTTPPGNVRVCTRFRFTQLSSAVKNGVPPPTRTG
jgi:hypothetical protein